MPRFPPELMSALRPDGEGPMARLGQLANLAAIDELGCGEWTILYLSQGGAEGSSLYSGLLPRERVAQALKQAGWDLFIGDGVPGFAQNCEEGETITTYERFCGSKVEPILFVRNFYGIKPSQIELSEEFRLFHNLYHDRHNEKYIYVDDRGGEVLAADNTRGCTRVLTRLLRQYMAARQLDLALFFEYRVFADVAVEEAQATFPLRNVVESDRCYSFNVGEISSSKAAFSRLIGKKIIHAPPVTESGIWPYETTQPALYEEFIIGVGADGLPVRHSCDPDALANYFGANEDAPHYLTPVWFTRSVLAKYYDDSIRFSIEDGLLRCGSLWSLQIDNNLPDHVVVYLGDLGRDLVYEEQGYWKHFNVTPGDRRPSGANFRRSFEGQFADPSEPDLIFKQRYTRLNEIWTKKNGWPIYLPLHEADAHIVKQFRAPISEGLGEFEAQLLYLVKLIIDSLNEDEFARSCGGSLPDEKGISKFKRFLETQKYRGIDRDITLLRNLQDLRSTGAAHHKGRKYDKIRTTFGLDRNTPRNVFRDILLGVNAMLNDLSDHFASPSE